MLDAWTAGGRGGRDARAMASDGRDGRDGGGRGAAAAGRGAVDGRDAQQAAANTPSGAGGARERPRSRRRSAGPSGASAGFSSATVRCLDGAYRFDNGKPVAWRCWSCGAFMANDAKQDCRFCGEVRIPHPLGLKGVNQKAAFPVDAGPGGRQSPDPARVADAERRRRDALAAAASGAASPSEGRGACGAAGPGAQAAAGAAAGPPLTRAQRAAAEAKELVGKYLPAVADPGAPAALPEPQPGPPAGEAQPMDLDEPPPSQAEPAATAPGDPAHEQSVDRRAKLVDAIAILAAHGDPLKYLPALRQELEAFPAEPEPAHVALRDAQRMSVAAAAKEREAAALRAQLEAQRKALDAVQSSLAEAEAEASRLRLASSAASAQYSASAAAAPGAAAASQPLPSAPALDDRLSQLAATAAAELAGAAGAGGAVEPDPAMQAAIERAVRAACAAAREHDRAQAGVAAPPAQLPDAPATPPAPGSPPPAEGTPARDAAAIPVGRGRQAARTADPPSPADREANSNSRSPRRWTAEEARRAATEDAEQAAVTG